MGIALRVVAIVGGAWVVVKSRRKKAKAKGESAGAAAGEPGTVGAEVDGKSAGEYRPELEASQAPVEIGGGHDRRSVPVELEGGQRGWGL